MNTIDLSASQLNQAACIQEQIENLQAELTIILGAGTPAAPVVVPVATPVAAPATAVAPTAPKQRTMSAAAKQRMSDFQKARWAKLKGATPAAPAKPAAAKKFIMSASAKAAISKAATARWAKIRAAQKK